MHLRLSFVLAAVALAGIAATWRAMHPAPAPAPFIAEAGAGASPHRTARTAGNAAHAEHPPDAKIVVYVAGQVRRSGLYRLAPDARAADALAAAGGPAANADMVAVNLAESLADGDEVAVPAIDAAPLQTRHRRTKRTTAGHHTKRHRKRHAPPHAVDATADDPGTGDALAGRRIDINAAGEAELESLPGLGATLAERIVAFREASGPYATTDDLLDVAGMTPAKLDALAPYVTAGGGASAAGSAVP